MLTGRDTDEIILSRLDDKDLAAICQIDSRAREFCSRQDFWKRRIIQRYGERALLPNLTDFRDFYQSGKVKTYSLCQTIPRHNQLVIEDFYDPNSGYYNSAYTRDPDGLTYLLLKIARDKYESLGNEVMTSKLGSAIPLVRADIPVWRVNEFSDTLNFTDRDETMFLKLIDVRLTAPELLRNKARSNPGFVKSVSPDPIKTFRLLDHIHTGFRTRQLPLDILWSELCSHPYILNYRVK